MRTFTLLSLCLFALFILGGCQGMRGKHVDHLTNIDDDEVKEQIALLSNGQHTQDPDAEARYTLACEKLIKMGAGVEPHIIFELKNSKDWAVRLGCIEVADAVGTIRCVEPFIELLNDPHPLVAQKAMYSLRVFCGHRIVPDADSPGAPVPPIPRRGPNEPIEKDYQLWSKWHEKNHKVLHRSWTEWWKAHKAEVKVE